VRLTWTIAAPVPIRAEIHRRVGESGPWVHLGEATAQGDRLVFEDHDIIPGARQGYRLVEVDQGLEMVLDEVWVTVPLRSVLGLAGASPNPAGDELAVAFSLPATGAAALELFDLRGRLLARRQVGGLGAGGHRVVLHDARHRSELVKEDGMGERRRRTAPPAVDDLDDVVVVLLAEGAGEHG
jgi:hypothetical protein